MGASRHRLAVVTWLAIYPTITLVLPGLEALNVNDLALLLRTLAISVVVVPAVVYVVSPALTRLLGGWLYGATTRQARRDLSPPSPNRVRCRPAADRPSFERRRSGPLSRVTTS